MTITFETNLTPSLLRALASQITRGVEIDDPTYLAVHALAEAIEEEAEEIEGLETFESEWAATHPTQGHGGAPGF